MLEYAGKKAEVHYIRKTLGGYSILLGLPVTRQYPVSYWFSESSLELIPDDAMPEDEDNFEDVSQDIFDLL